MKRLSIGILTLMLAIPASPVGDRTAHAADSILTNVLHRGTVRIAITTGAPPTRFEDENGTLQGCDVDIANLLAKQLGVTIDYIKTDTAGRVAMLQTKKGRHYDRLVYPEPRTAEVGRLYRSVSHGCADLDEPHRPQGSRLARRF